jgi:hypothetical protein
LFFHLKNDIAILSGIKIEEDPNSVGAIESSKSFKLGQNYPNPFNPTTKINFTLPQLGKAVYCKLTIYDSLGQEVENLIDGYKTPGNYTLDFNGEQLSSGIYFYRLSAGDFVATKKMLLLK